METYFNIRYEFDKDQIHKKIKEQLLTKNCDYICVASGTILTQVHRSLEYREAVNGGLFTICDSSWVPIYLKKIYGIERSQYCGAQIFEDIVKSHKYRMYFLGSSKEILKGLKQNLEKWNPDVNNMTFKELPFANVDEFDYKTIASEIDNDNADIIWIALGAPKQEFFMQRLKPYLNHGVMIAVGAVFGFFSGQTAQRAPKWMVKNHLEFLYRMVQEPKKQIMRNKDILWNLPAIIKEEKVKSNSTKTET